jgi:hypothetical protein
MVRKTIAAAIALCAFAVTPAFVLAQDTTNQTQIFTTMTGPEKDYGMTLYNAIPVSEQPGFITYLTGFPPDQRVMIVRTLHMYSVAPNLTPFGTDTTATTAMPVFMNVLTPTDQPSFTTFWNGMTPDQQMSFINYARDVYPQTTTMPTTMPAATQTETTTTTTETTGMAAQPFGVTMAAAFVGFLPESEHDTYMKLASYTPTSELGGMDNFLQTLTPEQAGMCIHVIGAINAMGMAGAKPHEGMSDYNVKKLMLAQVPDADRSNFESMMSGMNDQQISTLEQLARDAFNGGMNDIGPSAATGNSGK